MKISVITVCFNSAVTLRDTLESVLKQSCTDYELIVVDGGSTDSTLELLREYEPKFEGRMSWFSDADKGIYDAMNKGIAMARGEIIGFLNSDDYYYDEHVIRDIVSAFENNPSSDAIHGNLQYINTQGKICRIWQGKDYRPGAFQKGWMPAHPTFYCKRFCFTQFGNFDLSIGSAADFELMLRFIEKHRITTNYINRFFIYMRTGGSSTSGIRAVLRNTRQNQQAFRKNGILIPWYYPLSRFKSKISQLAQLFRAY